MIDMVQKQSVVDLAVGSITSYICGSNLAIGDKLPPEVQMTHMLGISRPALREAYARLQVFGFIDLLPGRGAFVRSKNKNFATDPLAWFKEHKAQIKDYLEVRLELDPLAASLAARNRSNDDIRMPPCESRASRYRSMPLMQFSPTRKSLMPLSPAMRRKPQKKAVSTCRLLWPISATKACTCKDNLCTNN